MVNFQDEKDQRTFTNKDSDSSEILTIMLAQIDGKKIHINEPVFSGNQRSVGDPRKLEQKLCGENFSLSSKKPMVSI